MRHHFEKKEGDHMSAKILSKSGLTEFTSNLIKNGKVIGVAKKENKFAFAPLSNASDLVLDYDVALTPPRIFFQPSCEKLLSFNLGAKTELAAEIPSEPFVLMGVHTYDLKAINQMDRIWAETNPDEHYLARRRAATIIAMEPTKASKWSFWASMNGHKVDKGYDLLLTETNDSYVIEIGTEKGAALIAKHAPQAKDASPKDIEARQKVRDSLAKLCRPERKINTGPDAITALVKKSMDHGVWEKQAKKCYSCGSCNMVCPTCYCFDVKDNIELDLAHGTRSRMWDGCLLEEFASVGSGENFREHRKDRFRHRILRKTVFVAEKLGELACVGCGRCSEVCLPDITDPVKVINELVR